MESTAGRAIAIVGAGAVLPDAPNVAAFWENVKNGRYSITEVRPERWDPAHYYDPDPSVPDKTYSKIGGWVREHTWDPMKWRLPIPPRVADAMDVAQQWGIACTREALEDYGYPARPLAPERTAVILGNAMAGEMHYLTALRVNFPVYARELREAATFTALPEAVRCDIINELQQRIGRRLPAITEDSMPGELANCIAGRIANLYNFHGPNYVADAACASAMAAISAAVEGLVANHFDMAITGGIDRNMGASTFVKFCKIGALSATGTRPYADGADGFVMGEGAVIFLLKRLADAERDRDKIYAVLRGVAGASDGRGKGITAPNPIGQKLAIERAWQTAGLSPATATLVEGHGTSTRVGDAVEVESLMNVLGSFQLPPGSVALGSVKSNIGHLKGAASAAGLLKTALALRDKVLPPSVNCERPNPNIDFARSPLYVNTKLKPWTVPADSVRRAGLSAFGFGGTNFHAVLEEYIPHKLTGGNGNGTRSIVVDGISPAVANSGLMNAADGGAMNNLDNTNTKKEISQTTPAEASYKAPLRGVLVIGAPSEAALAERLRSVQQAAASGHTSAPAAPAQSDLRAPERLAIDYADAADLADKSGKALKALAANQPAIWKALRAQGVFRGRGPAPKVAFLYTGQGSQYVNMLQALRAVEPVVANTFAEADRVMTPLLGKPLSEFIFVEEADAGAVAQAEEDLRQTAITQPAVIASDIALTRLMAAYGIQPDMTMGHSVGEYGALVASGALPFEDALEAVSARGREMTRVSMQDNGRMAAVFAPLNEIERILKTVDGYVVIANLNSCSQAVIGGGSKAVEQAVEVFLKAGYNAVPLPVSHAFHTSIVAPASEPLRRMMERLGLQSPKVPIVANVNGEFYPTGPDVKPRMLDMLSQQVASPVQFVKGLRKLYEAGTRVFVEMGPKKALQGFVDDVLGASGDVVALFTNHPKVGDIAAFNQALCGLYAAGLGRGIAEIAPEITAKAEATQVARETPVKPTAPMPVVPAYMASPESMPLTVSGGAPTESAASLTDDQYVALGRMFADVLERGRQIARSSSVPPLFSPVVITGAALGLPGTERIFDDTNVSRILRGDQFIDAIPTRFRRAMLDKNITRLVKSNDGGAFESIDNVGDVIKLAARGGAFDLEKEFGVSAERIAALDRVTRLAIGAGIDALRDAGIPLVLHYKTTSKGTQLPNRWALPNALRDDTGVIFASAFPGYDSLVGELSHYYADRAHRVQLAALESLRARAVNGHALLGQELDRLIDELRNTLKKEPYAFDRRFMFRILAMGHSQFAELIGARGPNTHVNAACASTTQGVALAEDWIRAGRCRRVAVISADDVTSDHLMDWMGAAFLVTGAAATGEVVEETALPFDRRRNGMLLGMGAAALVVESADAARERGLRPICEVLGTVTANSAFHGTRLDVEHISQVMETVVAQAESRGGISRRQAAPQMVFVSHETYTPARGGSAAAEIHALRRVFGEAADRIVIANTKGFTGHAMGTGIEDVVAVKALETGCVPPVANFKEVDPELGALNLSKGGLYPIEYALRLGAGFGSQISMTLLRWVKTKDGVRPYPDALGYSYRIADTAAWENWLRQMAGYPAAELEVVQRTLRLRDQKRPARLVEAAPNSRPVPSGVSEDARIPLFAEAPPNLQPPTAPRPAPVASAAIEALPAIILSFDNKVAPVVTRQAGKPGVKTEAVESAPPAPPTKIKLSTPAPVDTAQDSRPAGCEKQEIKAGITAPAPVVSAPSAPGSDSADVKARILALVVEKTGYPKDMLDLELDLEADLGVDTVKQAELFAAIRETYDIPRDANLKLRDFPTLAHVIQFVYDKRPDLVGAPVSAAKEKVQPATPVPAQAGPDSAAAEQNKVAAVVPAKVSATEDVKERLLALVVEKTGYPKDMLDLELDLEADLGVDTVKQAELFAAIREVYDIPRDQNLKLRDFPTLAHVIQFVYDKRPDLAGVPVSAAKEEMQPAPLAPTQAAPVSALAGESKVDAGQPAAASGTENVKERILALVVEKTGYPKDMLDLELDLEADLGVDTVKQAEMFAAIREIYGIPRDQNLKLRDFPTLAHVIQFVYDRRPDLAEVPATAAKEEVKPIAPAPVEVASAKESGDATEEIKVATSASATMLPDEESDEAIKERILALVVEKTGYPKDMLDLELDLEADLGVDTVKQAEMFAAIREIYNIPRDANLKLRDFPTLAHVIKFAHDRRPRKAQVPEPKPAAAPAASVPTPAARPRSPLASLDAANAIPRRVPVPSLRPALAVCKPTGVTLSRGQRVIVMPDQGGVWQELSQRLQNMGLEVLLIEGGSDAEALANRLKDWLAAGPVQGVFWLPALDKEVQLGEMDSAAWRQAMWLRLKALYTTMRTLYEQVAAPDTFLVSATRLGGQHGYDEAGAFAPMGGAVVGFTKAYKRERTEALVKAVDFEPQCSAAQVAELLIAETQHDPGAVEIGYKGGERWTIGLREQPAADGQPGLMLDQNTVFLVTGAAGGIVSAITSDLAAASGGIFYLLDLVPEPDPENPDLKRFASDKDGLKRELFARIQARGERATPALVERELAALERAQAACSAIQAVRTAGGTPYYFSVNLTDADAVAKVISQVRERSGRIDVLLHAAGMERSHFLPDKDQREFDLVFDVKSDGWFNLLRATGDMPLGATVAFSSIAGRFGNGGQADYSSANDLLCKITSSFRTSWPATRGIAIDWTAWGGIGMATRGSIPKMMELAGIDMLPPEAGVPLIRRELTAGGTRGEIVVGQRLGILVKEWDETGGLDSAVASSNERLATQGPMITKIASMGLHSGLTIETTLDPKVQPFLHDHQIDGTPVLPGVMGIEAFAEAALSILPGWRVEAVEEINFLAPFKFYRNEPRTLTVQAMVSAQADTVVADCQLTGARQLPNQAVPQVTTHFTACVRLTKRAAEAVTIPAPAAVAGSIIQAADIYRYYFHGPAYQVLERAWRDGDRIVGQMSKHLPNNHRPAECPTLMSPRLIELCFQTAGLWEMGVKSRMGLPHHIRQVSVWRTPELAESPLYAMVTPSADGTSFDADVVDAAGNRYVHLSGYRTVALPNSIDAEPLRALGAVA
jgi:acyl transferase domain-containing protein/acyl carrier protein/NAD(P)-dependent dehydrogenase (short-subunit alcohol dehydrogenase family)